MLHFFTWLIVSGSILETITEAESVSVCNETNYKKYFPCGEGFTALLPGSEHCVKVGTANATRNDALAFCYQHGASEAQITTRQFDDAITQFEDFKDDVWTGMKIHKQVPLHNHTQPQDYANWVEPPNATSEELCVVKSKQDGGQWRAEPCNLHHLPLCQKHKAPTIVSLTNLENDLDLPVGEKFHLSCMMVGHYSRKIVIEVAGDGQGYNDFKLTIKTPDPRIKISTFKYSEYDHGWCVVELVANVKLVASYLMHDKDVTCCGYAKGQRRGCGSLGNSLNVTAKVGVPHLETFNEANSIRAHCVAVVARGKPIVWVLVTPRDAWTWHTNYMDRAMTLRGDAVPGVTVGNVTVSTNESGDIVGQTVVLTASWLFDDSRLVCFNDFIYHGDPRRMLRAKDALRSEVHRLLRFILVCFHHPHPQPIRQEPQRPEFHEVQNIKVNMTLVKRATCVAYVGSTLTMTWFVHSRNFSNVWHIGADANVSGLVPDAVNLYNISVEYTVQRGAYIASTVEVMVDLIVEPNYLGHLACLAYHMDGPISDLDPQDPLMVSISLDIGPSTHEVNSTLLMWLRYGGPSALLIFLMCVLFVATKPYKKKPKPRKTLTTGEWASSRARGRSTLQESTITPIERITTPPYPLASCDTLLEPDLDVKKESCV